MKKVLLIIFILIISAKAYPQNASTYFPSNTGYKWYYKNIPLDSNNNPVLSLSTYRVDSFAVVENYKGLLANVVRIKDGLLTPNQQTPYTDTNWFNFQTTNAWAYLSLTALADTTIIPYPGFINFLRSLENWYNLFRFAQTVNVDYTIISKDTTIAIDTITLPLRVKLKCRRLNDQVIQTINGNYNTKRFVATYGLYYRLLIFEIPILEKPDSVWFAQNVWMVKEVSPSVRVDLTAIGFPINFVVPGNMYELTDSQSGIGNENSGFAEDFRLEQNYPNPFNPKTKINYFLPSAEDITLAVFDGTGKEIKTLVSGKKEAGIHSVEFDGNGLPSGVYFYRLQAGKYSETKKLVLLK